MGNYLNHLGAVNTNNSHDSVGEKDESSTIAGGTVILYKTEENNNNHANLLKKQQQLQQTTPIQPKNLNYAMQNHYQNLINLPLQMTSSTLKRHSSSQSQSSNYSMALQSNREHQNNLVPSTNQIYNINNTMNSQVPRDPQNNNRSSLNNANNNSNNFQDLETQIRDIDERLLVLVQQHQDLNVKRVSSDSSQSQIQNPISSKSHSINTINTSIQPFKTYKSAYAGYLNNTNNNSQQNQFSASQRKRSVDLTSSNVNYNNFNNGSQSQRISTQPKENIRPSVNQSMSQSQLNQLSTSSQSIVQQYIKDFNIKKTHQNSNDNQTSSQNKLKSFLNQNPGSTIPQNSNSIINQSQQVTVSPFEAHKRSKSLNKSQTFDNQTHRRSYGGGGQNTSDKRLSLNPLPHHHQHSKSQFISIDNNKNPVQIHSHREQNNHQSQQFQNNYDFFDETLFTEGNQNLSVIQKNCGGQVQALKTLQKYLHEISQSSNSYSVQKVFVKQFQERLQLLEKLTTRCQSMEQKYSFQLQYLESQDYQQYLEQYERDMQLNLQGKQEEVEDLLRMLKQRETELQERELDFESRQILFEQQLHQIDKLEEKEHLLIMKQEELKSIKDSIYEKVLQKKQELELINEELNLKESSLKVYAQQLECKKQEMEKVEANKSLQLLEFQNLTSLTITQPKIPQNNYQISEQLVDQDQPSIDEMKQELQAKASIIGQLLQQLLLNEQNEQFQQQQNDFLRNSDQNSLYSQQENDHFNNQSYSNVSIANQHHEVILQNLHRVEHFNFSDIPANNLEQNNDQYFQQNNQIQSQIIDLSSSNHSSKQEQYEQNQQEHQQLLILDQNPLQDQQNVEMIKVKKQKNNKQKFEYIQTQQVEEQKLLSDYSMSEQLIEQPLEDTQNNNDINMSFHQLANLMMEAEYRMTQTPQENDSSIMQIDRASMDSINNLVENDNQQQQFTSSFNQDEYCDRQHFSFDKDKMHFYNVEEQQKNQPSDNVVHFTLKSDSHNNSINSSQISEQSLNSSQNHQNHQEIPQNHSQNNNDNKTGVPLNSQQQNNLQQKKQQQYSGQVFEFDCNQLQQQNKKSDENKKQRDNEEIINDGQNQQQIINTYQSASSSGLSDSNYDYLNDDFAQEYIKKQEQMLQELKSIYDQKEWVKDKFAQLASEFENNNQIGDDSQEHSGLNHNNDEGNTLNQIGQDNQLVDIIKQLQNNQNDMVEEVILSDSHQQEKPPVHRPKRQNNMTYNSL
eukprot:403359844